MVGAKRPLVGAPLFERGVDVRRRVFGALANDRRLLFDGDLLGGAVEQLDGDLFVVVEARHEVAAGAEVAAAEVLEVHALNVAAQLRAVGEPHDVGPAVVAVANVFGAAPVGRGGDAGEALDVLGREGHALVGHRVFGLGKNLAGQGDEVTDAKPVDAVAAGGFAVLFAQDILPRHEVELHVGLNFAVPIQSTPVVRSASVSRMVPLGM